MHIARIAVLLSVVASASACAGMILVDLGDAADARSVGYGEATVTWGDAEARDELLCTQAFAACELQRYLRQMTGRADDWRIVDDSQNAHGRAVMIQMAPSADAQELGPEGYRLRSSPSADGWRVSIIGGGRVGTLYGVYDLLHRLGVRWYAPGAENEEVPRVPLDSVPPMDIAERPAFILRGFHAWENRGDEPFLLWMARNRLNYWCVQQENKPLMHKLGIQLIGGGHRLTDWYLGPRKPYPYNHPRFAGDDTKPVDPYAVSDGYQGDGDGNGTLTYFEAHPDWYALRDGKRSPRISGDGGDNFCTSDPDAVTEWVRNAVADLAAGANRDAGMMNAWMLDGGKWCECEECKRQGTRTDRNLQVVHEYAKGIKIAQSEGRINRPIRLLFLAYADVLEPPSKPLPPDFDYDMCIATYFPICRCYVHTLQHPEGCSRNVRYHRHLHGWAVEPKRHYRGQLCIGEYYNVSGYKCLPICFMHSMAADIPYSHSLGARYFHYMHCTTRNWGNKALTNWQMARQLWNPGADCTALWTDYFTGRYGPAAGDMRQFYENLERMLCNVTELKYNLARRLHQGSATLYPGGHLRYETAAGEAADVPSVQDMLQAAATCRRIVDGVLEQELPKRVRDRVEEDRGLFTYGERTLRYFDLASRAFFTVREGRRDEARTWLRELRQVADQLRADTASTTFASSHANAANAFSATYATGALARLEDMLGPVAPEEVKTLVSGREPLVLTHLELQGGGAQRYTYGFCKYPGRIPISETGNFVYGQGTSPHDVIRCWFRLPAAYAGGVYLTLAGALTPVHGEGRIPGTVCVNTRLLYAGDMPFVEGAVTNWMMPIPASLLAPGVNRIELRNTHPEGMLGNRPWYGIDRIELSTVAPDPEKAAPMPLLKGPADLRLSYRSQVDGTEQPYRVYLPSAYDGKARLPLLLALHGTGGSQDTYFDSSQYANGIYKREAEVRGTVVVCPHGRGTTEYRGIGENDVLTVLDEVGRQFAVDEDRIVCTGQSMGGTGTSYLCSRYPDLFAGGIALASGYCHVNMLANLRYVPMLYVQGAKDWPVYAREGPDRITGRLQELGYPCDYWVVPDQPHNTMAVSTTRVFDWALQQRRVRSPRHVTHAVYLPIHGRAYWTELLAPAEIGLLTGLDARVADPNRINVTTHNASAFALYPDAPLIDLTQPVRVAVDGEDVFAAVCPSGKAIELSRTDGVWRAELSDRIPRPYTAHRTHRIGTVVSVPTQSGKDETTLGNWMTDMMRHVTGADVAVYNRRHYRGVVLRTGQIVYLADLYDWLRPFVRRLGTFSVHGRDLLDIIEANIRDTPKEAEYLVQVSGCRYAFDRSRPPGERVVETDIEPGRVYTVACEAQALTRETLFLAGRFGTIEWEELEPTAVSGAWRYIVDCGGTIEAKREGRVRDVTGGG